MVYDNDKNPAVIIKQDHFNRSPILTPRGGLSTQASDPHPIESHQQPEPHVHNHPNPLLKKSWTNPSFMGANFAMYAFAFLFIYQFIIISKPSFWLPVLIIFCILLFMTLWCYYTTVCSSPGVAPFYYGLSDEIDTHAIRKYCIICHNFKPERTHHCSSCSKCVLNMDHHCPWVNNCIGFYNRKYFILFLIYITVGLIFSAIIQIIVMIGQIRKAIQTKHADVHFIIKCIVMVFTFVISFALFSFTLFHIKMILRNTTTLEGIIHKRKNPNEQQDTNNYDVGAKHNAQQVFGQSCLYWFIPVKGNGPRGNGTNWPRSLPNYNQRRNDQQGTPIYNPV